MNLYNKVALITGSSRGIGKAIAMRLANEGANVILNSSRSVEEARKALAQLPKIKKQRHYFIQANIKEGEQIAAMMREIKKRYGKLDILINNAGITHFIDHHNLNGLTVELFDEIYQVNLRGAFFCIQQAYPLLRKGKDPIIINIASIAGTTAVGSNIAYCAMKAALINMTKSLARALAPEIRVNTISPGLTATNLTMKWGSYRAEQLNRTPLGRLGKPEDIADAVFAVATSLSYVTGQDIVTDGGRTLG